MRLGLLLLAGAAAFTPHPPAPAPQPSIENIYWVANCLLARHDANVEQVLSLAPGAPASRFSWLHATIGPCLVAEHPMTGPPLYERGAVAEGLLYRDFAALGGTPRHRLALVFAPVGAELLNQLDAHARTQLAVLDVTSCIAEREPARVYAYFATPRGSPAEREAMAALMPAISACVAAGQSFEMSPSLFRAFLAEGAYRVAVGQPHVFAADR